MGHFKKRSFWTIILLSLALTPYIFSTYSQESIKESTGTWMVIAGNNQISERWSIPTVIILREYNLTEETEFGFFRTGLTYKVNPNLKVTGGIAYLDTQPFDHDEREKLTTQFWVYQELSLKNSANWSQRLRFEHRWITGPKGNTLNNRVRYRLQYSKPLFDNTYIKSFNESFYDFTKGKYNQNRFYVGLGQKINKDISVEVGYLKNHVGKNNYNRIRMSLLFKTRLFKRKPEDFTQHQKLSNTQ